MPSLPTMAATREYLISSVTGVPIREIINYDILGSAYLFDTWKLGSVIISDGREYNDLKLKFDILHNRFFFNRNDTVFEFQDDVREIKLKAIADNSESLLIFEKVINANGRIPSGTFVQILSTGKVTLLKRHLKTIEGENISNGLFETKKQIVSHNSYWATLNNETIPVKLNKSSLEELISDKKVEVANFMKWKKLNPKNEKDFAAAIDFYNSISTSPKK